MFTRQYNMSNKIPLKSTVMTGAYNGTRNIIISIFISAGVYALKSERLFHKLMFRTRRYNKVIHVLCVLFVVFDGIRNGTYVYV